MPNKLSLLKSITSVVQKVVGATVFLSPFWTTPVWANTLNFEQMYIFGDSNSDQGNVLNVSGFPPEPYFYQGRFTNGPNWVDYLSSDLGLNPEISTNLPPGSSSLPTDGINFTFGGATSGDVNIGNLPGQPPLLPGLQQQVDYFADLLDGATANTEALYMIWIGPNDYVYSLNNGVIDPNIPTTSVNNVTAAIDELNALGANNILVFNEPNIALTPLGQTLPPEAIAFLSGLTDQQNALLDQSVNQLNQANPELNLASFDTDGFFNEILNNPNEFGLNNITDNCSGVDFPNLPDSVDNFSPCDNPDEYLFWDNQHLTSAVHELIADEVLDTLESEFSESSQVPEPSMFAALGLFSFYLLMKKNGKI